MPWSFPALSNVLSAEAIVPAHLDTRPEVVQGFKFPTPVAGPQRGRPPGTFGTKLVRQQIREAKAQQDFAITPFMKGREDLAKRRRDKAHEQAEQAMRLPGGMALEALSPSALPVVGHAILSALTRRAPKHTENTSSLRCLALMGGFGRVAGLTRAAEFLCLRHSMNKCHVNTKTENRKVAIASLIWNSAHLIWLSLLSWLLVQLQFGAVRGILFMSYVEFDESAPS